MIDNRAEVYGILSKLDAEVTYRYPDNLLDKKYPKICYYTSNSTDIEYQDNKATGCKVETTVQIFEKNIDGILREIHTETDEIMKANSFYTTYYDNYYDAEDKTHIHTIRYEKKYSYEKERK